MITRRFLRRIPSQRGTHSTYVERPGPTGGDEIPVRVSYTYHPGYPDTWDEPGQPDHCEIDVISPAGIDLTTEEEARISDEVMAGLEG